jgi:chemotaxis signal transduction protein
MTALTPILRFKVCEQNYALAINQVVEVSAMVEIATLSEQMHPSIRGVVIRRGQPLVLVDLRRFFRCEAAPVTLETLFIVVQPDAHQMAGFIVDHVQGVLYLNNNDMRAVRGGHGYMRGVVAQEQQLIQWLDAAPILADTLPESQ